MFLINCINCKLFWILACRCGNSIDLEIVNDIKDMLDQHNVFAKTFKMAKESFDIQDENNLKLKLISNRKTDGRIYNLPIVSEVAALIVGDIDNS